ncbi:kinase-like domain-containing protein [Glomus cerebriforme]|uniref:Kinase-like domain-containing protein n=1 Tax=Glomus cerebriforme TaxID=658196 RepID=A0A397T3X2_9GLOM|nr:kinase-like domain-containing protein [Glomus cerebriforme]
MSNETDLKESKVYSDWLKKSIDNEYFNYYNYSEFKNLKQIGRSVIRANWRNTDRFFVLKTFDSNNTILKEVVNEIKLQKRVDFHENILRFYGITIAEGTSILKYSLVLEYADNGTLRTYLNEHFNDLNWSDKYQLAFQLTSAIACLHECDIIHRDLKNIKLSDFGLSRKIEMSNTPSVDKSNLFGVIPYIDPNKFNDRNYELNRKSDVYSTGVLMWQISSGNSPFSDKDYDIPLVLSIVSGLREIIIDGTPIEYSKLYTECWKYQPNERPDMQDVVSTLKEIIFPKENEIDLLEEYEINSESSKGTIDLNIELLSNSDLYYFDHTEINSFDSQQSDLEIDLSDKSIKPRKNSFDSSKSVDITEINDYYDWLEKSIANKEIKLYEYSDFNNIQPIGKGSFGSVVRVILKNTDKFFALKSFNNDESTFCKVIEEIQNFLMREGSDIL